VSHGKGACNKTGGRIKRLARKASLQNHYEVQVMTSRQLYKWAVLKIPSVTFEYCTVEDHCKETVMLKVRFKKA
jgi:hypothetical protein